MRPSSGRRPGIHNPHSWLWIPGSLVSLAPRNDGRAYTAASFLIAGLIDRAASSYPSRALVRANSAGTVRTVKRLGSRSPRTWAQVTGIDTVAPSRARVDSGPTAVDIRSLRK